MGGIVFIELGKTVPEEWHWVVEETKQLIAELPLECSKRLFELWKQIPENRAEHSGTPLSPPDQLRYLLIRLSKNWVNYRVFDWDKEVPLTSNRTEQAIGRMKMRSRMMRGYKSWQGMQAALK